MEEFPCGDNARPSSTKSDLVHKLKTTNTHTHTHTHTHNTHAHKKPRDGDTGKTLPTEMTQQEDHHYTD